MVGNLLKLFSAVFAAVFLALAANSLVFHETSIPHIDMRIAATPAEVSPCPLGWNADTSPTLDQVSRRCIQGNWVVHLYPNLEAANYGLDTGNPIYKQVVCTDIPKWPKTWCVGE